ncbi:MAG TPA: dihydropteroate synthase [Candidatus Thalassarchaeaceae archaeon]|nr:MAG TPA: dihydropteroate synthase [Candidatus Poseidoniales archaeon]HIH85163.1 dihydropteroate synthase [Candidatus Thalassarchaeaceae archaeon]
MPDWSTILRRRPDGRPRIMGVLNVTPDSFHADSRTNGIEAALKQASKMQGEGADWIDIGGESTRPGADPVSIDEEKIRVIPIIEAVRRLHPEIAISVDTRRPEVAHLALEAGANLINDVSGLRDPEMVELVLSTGAGVCIMHMQGDPKSMQDRPNYTDARTDVASVLLHRAHDLIESGHPPERICLDPGIGFGKRLEDNLALLSDADWIRGPHQLPVLWGVSRKSMFRDLLNRTETSERLAGTLGVAAHAQKVGVDILRVHDVAEHVDLGRTLAELEARR